MSDPDANAPANATAAKPGKTWRAGTLVYTSAGVGMVFFWLLLGDFVWSMRDRTVVPVAQWYLNHLGVSSLLFGLLITSLPAAIGLVVGPIISVKSDRHRGARGRRIPFLLVATPIAAAGMIGMGLTPLVARGVHALFPMADARVAAIVCLAVFLTVYESGSIVVKSVFGGLVNDVVPKELLGRFYGLFRVISLADGIVFNFWIMGFVPTHHALILCVIGAVYGAAFMWVCLKVREGGYPAPSATPGGGGRETRGAAGWARRGALEIRRYCRECYTQSYYVALFVMMMFAVVAFVPVHVFSIPQARSLGISMDAYGKCMAASYVVSLGLSFFIGWLADKFHPLRVSMAMMAGYAAVTAWGGFCATTQQAFLVAYVLHTVLAGAYYTGAASLGLRLFPHARFAQFASAGEVVFALAYIVVAPLVGTLIDASGKNYRLTFFAGSVLAACAFLCALHVHARFKKFGGTANYSAPE